MINKIGRLHMAHFSKAFGEPAAVVILGHEYQHGGHITIQRQTE